MSLITLSVRSEKDAFDRHSVGMSWMNLTLTGDPAVIDVISAQWYESIPSKRPERKTDHEILF